MQGRKTADFMPLLRHFVGSSQFCLCSSSSMLQNPRP
jgi:hypothetical protein